MLSVFLAIPVDAMTMHYFTSMSNDWRTKNDGSGAASSTYLGSILML